MKIKLLLSLLVFFVFFSAKAQFNESIISARPGISNGPFSVGKNVYQIQTGVSFEKWNVSNGSVNGYILDNNTVLRIGIFERTEIRGALEYNFQDQYSFSTINPLTGKESRNEITNTGVTNSSLGIRQNLTKQDGLIPSIGLQLTALFGGNKTYKADNTALQFRMLLQYKIFNKLIFNSNITGSTKNDNLQYVFSCAYPVTQEFRLIAEVYGTKFSKDSFFTKTISTNFNLGAGYLLTNNLQIDLFGGLGKEPSNLKFGFISAGMSYRVHKRE